MEDYLEQGGSQTSPYTMTQKKCRRIVSSSDLARESGDGRREEVLAAARDDEGRDAEASSRVGGIDTKSGTSSAVASLADDGVETRVVRLAEDECRGVSPGVLLEAEAARKDRLVSDESQATFNGRLARSALSVGHLRAVWDTGADDLVRGVSYGKCEMNEL